MSKCNQKTEVYSRVVGFYRPVQQWNDGKQEEFKNRKAFKAEPVPNRKFTFKKLEDSCE